MGTTKQNSRSLNVWTTIFSRTRTNMIWIELKEWKSTTNLHKTHCWWTLYCSNQNRESVPKNQNKRTNYFNQKAAGDNKIYPHFCIFRVKQTIPHHPRKACNKGRRANKGYYLRQVAPNYSRLNKMLTLKKAPVFLQQTSQYSPNCREVICSIRKDSIEHLAQWAYSSSNESCPE